jgi:hypothetical protein
MENLEVPHKGSISGKPKPLTLDEKGRFWTETRMRPLS